MTPVKLHRREADDGYLVSALSGGNHGTSEPLP
jgi:hypothetical protein